MPCHQEGQTQSVSFLAVVVGRINDFLCVFPWRTGPQSLPGINSSPQTKSACKVLAAGETALYLKALFYSLKALFRFQFPWYPVFVHPTVRHCTWTSFLQHKGCLIIGLWYFSLRTVGLFKSSTFMSQIPGSLLTLAKPLFVSGLSGDQKSHSPHHVGLTGSIIERHSTFRLAHCFWRETSCHAAA